MQDHAIDFFCVVLKKTPVRFVAPTLVYHIPGSWKQYATCQQEESLVAFLETTAFKYHGLKFKLSPILCMVMAIPPFMILGMGTAKLVSDYKCVCVWKLSLDELFAFLYSKSTKIYKNAEF